MPPIVDTTGVFVESLLSEGDWQVAVVAANVRGTIWAIASIGAAALSISSAMASANELRLLPEEYFESLPEEFQVRKNFDQTRDTFWPAFASFILPGFDQWWEGQDPYGPTYSLVATGGYLYAAHHASKSGQGNDDEEDGDGFHQPSERLRRVLWGLQLFQLSGSLSSYHAYRTALWTHKSRGRYSFIGRQESMQEIMTAPFKFSYLTRSTTLWPIGIGLALHLMSKAAIKADPDLQTDAFTASDAFFSSSISYGAGVGEEPLFRGWMMPEFREAFGSDFWSNAATSVLFAAAHLQSVERPIAQLALGYYWGYLTQKNNWEISESIFIHTWWDVIAFLTVFQIAEKEQVTDSRITPALHLPPFEWSF